MARRKYTENSSTRVTRPHTELRHSFNEAMWGIYSLLSGQWVPIWNELHTNAGHTMVPIPDISLRKMGAISPGYGLLALNTATLWSICSGSFTHAFSSFSSYDSNANGSRVINAGYRGPDKAELPSYRISIGMYRLSSASHTWLIIQEVMRPRGENTTHDPSIICSQGAFMNALMTSCIPRSLPHFSYRTCTSMFSVR